MQATHSEQLDMSWAVGGDEGNAPRLVDSPANYSTTQTPAGNNGNQGGGLLPGVLVSVESRTQAIENGLSVLAGNGGLDRQQAGAVAILQGGKNVFLTGMAGTGKSHTLLNFIGQSFRRVDACATTGIAALNLQDQFMRRAGVALPARTIYSYAGIGLGPAQGQPNEVYFAFLEKNMTRSRMNAYKRIRSAEALIIDEISMLPGRVLDYLDFHFRRVRGIDLPFGGIQMIAVGDFCQLPPVAKNGKYDWAFLSPSWRGANFRTVFLSQIHRQADPLFAEALNCFRIGNISKVVADTMIGRVKMFVNRDIVRLMTHNSQVEKWNAYQLGEIDAKEEIYDAKFSGASHEQDFLRKNCVTPDALVLKRGCRVMVTANLNDPATGNMLAVNGQCGRVAVCLPESVTVKLDGPEGKEIEVPLHQWQFDPQREDSATMTQIPLRLAYSLTIHKSQGLTLERAHIDIRAAREPGQAYVALSRVKSLSGLYLKEWPKSVSVSMAAINFYKEFQNV
jgi:ATP-dependent DNA helicase PIF1